MRQTIFEIKENIPLTKNVYKMILSGDTSHITRPGQFVNIKIDGLFLRRPISVCDCEGDTLTLIYKAVGKGTEQMAAMAAGDMLDILTGLGNGYNTENAGSAPLLIGGGVGVPPMYMLARKLIAEGGRPSVILGFNTAGEVFFEEEFKALGCSVTITTVDGSRGTKGFVTNAMKSGYTYFYTCGPEPMLRAVYDASDTDGQFSFEERMGCGFGVCMGCTCKTLYKNKRICRDGPVLEKGEIVWAK